MDWKTDLGNRVGLGGGGVVRLKAEGWVKNQLLAFMQTCWWLETRLY